MPAQGFDVEDLESAGLEGSNHLRESEHLTVREHVAWDERVRIRRGGAGVPGDGVVEQPAARPEQPVQLGDIAGHLLAAHVLGHTDGADRVKGPVVDVAIVLDPDGHPVRQTGVCHPLGCQGRLFTRRA